MRRFLKTQLFLTMLLLWSCQPEMVEPVDEGTDSETETDFVVETILPAGDEKYLNTSSDYIYDQNQLHTFELNLPSESLAQIDADPAAEEYVEGSLTFEGETISPVGIRYKGSIGAFVDCLSGTNWANPSGYKTCTKLSMKVKINWEGREEKFYGVKKLQFHSQNLDPSQMRERLGYWLFREMGVPAPRSVHVRLMINGKFSGVYALTEQIDGRFTRYNYEDGKGNLYKEIWPLSSTGHPQSNFTYIQHLKTNEDENPTADMIKEFATEIAQAEEEELKAVIDKWMDVDEIIAYAAVDRTIRNDDGAFHWYCNFGGCSPHNFYWYEQTDARTMHLIPWDLDNAFENIIHASNPVTPIANAWGEISADCEPFSFGTFGIQQRSAACDKLVRAWTLFTAEYEQQLEELKSGPLSAAQADVLLDTWTEQIRAAIQEASEKHDDAPTIEEWERGLQEIKAQVTYAREH